MAVGCCPVSMGLPTVVCGGIDREHVLREPELGGPGAQDAESLPVRRDRHGVRVPRKTMALPAARVAVLTGTINPWGGLVEGAFHVDGPAVRRDRGAIVTAVARGHPDGRERGVACGVDRCDAALPRLSLPRFKT